MEKLELNREYMYFGKVAYVEKQNILCTRNIIFGTNSSIPTYINGQSFKTPIMDINYKTPNYYYINLNSEEPHIGIIPQSIMYLSPLLGYFGFSETLDETACLDMMDTLFNGRFPYDFCHLFGYKRKINSYWQNGRMNSDLFINEKYDFRHYELEDKTNLMRDYFTLLALNIPVNQPEKSFFPLNEEKQIRKRILK